jgi:hypothetical protein
MLKNNVLQWLLTGQVGASSRAMATHLCGVPCDGSYPRDPDDFNRCLLFLEAVPEARDLLPRMAAVSPTWAALVARWAEIEAAFTDEVGLNWRKSDRAPNTYRLMREAIESARQGHGAASDMPCQEGRP